MSRVKTFKYLGKFSAGERVRKKGEAGKNSQWRGYIVGVYKTSITKVGYAVESELETGSVQIYPEVALERY